MTTADSEGKQWVMYSWWCLDKAVVGSKVKRMITVVLVSVLGHIGDVKKVRVCNASLWLEGEANSLC